LDVAGHRGLVSYIDAGIVTYEITDVNFSFGVLERAVLFEDIQLLLFQLSFEIAILKPF
jgi:hypothetical protein